jgi:hypothetical protein
MELWANIGIDVFNPPREAARTPSMLKEMSKAGFKLKVLLNEACIYGCSYMYNHACAVAEGTHIDSNCNNEDLTNILKTNLFLPRWMKYIDEYVYTYKLSGRISSQDKLKNILDAYILQKPMKYIHNYSTYSKCNLISKFLDINIKINDTDIPDKLRYCECKQCKTCNVCDDFVKQITRGINI